MGPPLRPDVVPPSPRERGVRARLRAVWRLRCPRCLCGPVFRSAHWRETYMLHACPRCGVVYGRESGYFTGAMIVSYMIAVPLGALLYGVLVLTAGVRLGWPFEWLFATTLLALVPLTPAIFRWSRVAWMHFDRLVDPDPENERYVALGGRYDRPRTP